MSENLVTDWRLDRLSQRLAEKESIINGISDALMLLEANTYKIIDVNRAFLSFYRLSRDEAIGKTCHEITHHLAKPCSQIYVDHSCPLEKSVSTGDLSYAEHVHKDSSGNDLYMEIICYPTKDAYGEVTRIIHLSRDVTNRRVAEQALKESSEKIKQFAYSVAHDLKVPAVGVYGLTKRLSKYAKDVLDEKGRNYCDQILKASEHIAALVDKINTYIETKEAPLCIERISIAEILQMLKEEFAVQLSIRQIDWLQPKTTVEIKADRLSMLRAFRNLVDNSLKYGGERLSTIWTGYEESEDSHIFSFSDNGKGLKEEVSEEIFRAFQRDGTSRGVEGAGLGLAIVKEIAEQHCGRVWVEPKNKKGITFYLSISKNL